MRKIHRTIPVISGRGYLRILGLVLGLVLLQTHAAGQNFEFRSVLYADSLALRAIVKTSGPDTITVRQGDYSVMSNAFSGSSSGVNFSIKSILAQTNFKINIQAPDLGAKKTFTYLITYKTIGTPNPAAPGSVVTSGTDTLSISYNRDSLKLINDRSFNIAGKFHKLMVVIYDVFEVVQSGSGPVYHSLLPSDTSTVPGHIGVHGEIYVQKFVQPGSLSMSGVTMSDQISLNGTVLLDWSGALSHIKPAGYEVEWTYVDPATASVPYSSLEYNFRNNATRIFTNKTSFRIPVAQKEGYLVYRVRMVRPDLNDLLSRTYGAWTISADQGMLSNVSGSRVAIQKTSNDDLNWDLKMNFVEDGKYKEVITYYDGLLKPKQVQTRFNSRPAQTIVAQSLYDYEGRAVISTLPIPVNGAAKLAYISNFLHPAGAAEYDKSSYDSLPDTAICPPNEAPAPPLAPNAPGNKYYSRYNTDKTGINAFIPDAEGYPFTRKIFAAENSEKLLFEGQAGAPLQLGNDRQMAYLYGSPLQAELNRYFGQDIGGYNYYRKMITTDNHQQDMFSITDEEGRPVATGLIGTPDTNSLALSVRNAPSDDSFQSNLLPVPNIRLDENWKNNGSYYVERDANYKFQYKIDYRPFKPCPNIGFGLMPKVYYKYEVIDNCGNIKLEDTGALGGIGMTASATLSHFHNATTFLKKGNHVWNKHSYIKLEDLRASVDTFLNETKGCFLTFNDFLKQEFLNARFPCEEDNDPCSVMKLTMMRELYPDAKYGKYSYADSASKTFGGPEDNSIFSLENEKYLYQADCLSYPDTIYSAGSKHYNIKNLKPQELIDIFNDSIAAALLPLHPDYCKLQFCDQVSNPYVKVLGNIKKASDAILISRFTLADIVAHDPLNINNLLTVNELSETTIDGFSIDDLAFKKTICGSEHRSIELTCSELNASKTPADIANYPAYMQDEYYQNLIKLYTANREERIGEKLDQLGNSCGPCADKRLHNPKADTLFIRGNDTTSFVGGMDSSVRYLGLPVNTSFGAFLDPVQASQLDPEILDSLINFDNSQYCAELLKDILNSLAGCSSSPVLLKKLEDTLMNRFCTNNGSLALLTYDSLNAILAEVGLPVNDLCNAGLADLRKATRASGEFVQPGLLHYAPSYYEDLSQFLETNQILDFIAGSSSYMNLSLASCNAHPFQQNLVRQLGGTLYPTSCSTTLWVQVEKAIINSSNAVRLSFMNGSNRMDYFLYSASRDGKNALNAGFGGPVISGSHDFRSQSLFNLYGFDQLTGTFANRNSILLRFKGTESGVQKNFSYFLSAFNIQADYNFMEKDQKEYLNGVGCSEFIPMAKNVIAMADQLNIKAGHPYFETFFTNVLNYQNKINFDFDNYFSAVQSCGLTDSLIIRKNLAHFRITFPLSVPLNELDSFIRRVSTDTLTGGVGISGVKAYKSGSYRYMLLDVFEANGKTIHDARQIIQAQLPYGSSLQYMPYLQKDTIAQLLSNNLSPVDLAGLAAAFPGAVIQNAPIELHYIIPGYGIFTDTGKLITMTRHIPGNYEYNHYLDSIYRFVSIHAPITPVLSHAESAVSAQYDDWQMSAWRNYVNSITPDNHNRVVKKSKAGEFNSVNASQGAYSFATSRFSYRNARQPYYLNNLYIDHEPNANAHYSYIKQLLQNLQTYNFNNFGKRTLLRPHQAPQPYIPGLNVTNTETRAYVCGDTTQFWINHFDTSNNMINIFIKLPAYLSLPRESYSIAGISKGFEQDSVTYLNLTLAAQSGGLKDTIHCIAYTNKILGGTYTIPAAFLASNSQFGLFPDDFQNCETRKIQALYPAARIHYHHYIDSVRDALVIRFRQHVIDSLQEQLSIMGIDIKHGVTLYYYDMAGNLLKTVSPGGVGKLNVSGSQNDTINAYRLRNEKANPLVPPHTKVTSYRYNAQNKVIETSSPDGGTTLSRYDRMGRVVLSQDARQSVAGQCAYFLYDPLSRLVETGLINGSTSRPDSFFTSAGSLVPGQVRNLSRREVTATLYDLPSYDTGNPFQALPAQENLKNRISCTRYFEAVAPGKDALTDTGYGNAVHYTYDISGNIKTLIYDLRSIVHPQMRFKRIDYEYDLYSGKVILVSYNRGYADQFYQKYSYDADNRIEEVHTSPNGILWDRDARYTYYDHGPLARTDLGEQRVQGVDYAYTINGWLKAINGLQNDTLSDMGRDGIAGGAMPKDVFSQRLDYFGGDYKAIADSGFFSHLPPTSKSLYNGNIAAIATALNPFDHIYKQYHYDPLQRIDRARYTEYAYQHATSLLTTAAIPDYASEYKYDPDGNLLKLRREGGTVSPALNGGVFIPQHNMDLLTYRYQGGTNRLRNLQDSSTSVAYKSDIPTLMGDSSLAHYSYDASGNMTRDLPGGLSRIEWNRFGKVSSVSRADGTQIQFCYDPMGNRLAKEVVRYPGEDSMVKVKTVYVRDAGGHSLAVYEDQKAFDLERLILPGVYEDPPGPGPDREWIPADFSYALARILWEGYQSDSSDNLASLALAVPSLEGYGEEPALLQELVSSLPREQELAFVKSMPAMTAYTLGNAEAGEGISTDKLSLYLQPVLLSENLRDLQTDLFVALKEHQPDLYLGILDGVPVSEEEKQDFPGNPVMLDMYNDLEIGVRLELTNSLAASLTGEYMDVLPAILSALLPAYSPGNTYGDFVLDVPNKDLIMDQLRSDALAYIAYRYGLAAMGDVHPDSVKNPFKHNSVLAAFLSGQTPGGSAAGLSVVLSRYFPQVAALARSSGKEASLTGALKRVLGSINMDLAPVALLPLKELLRSRQVHLGEHHIYGSSRLGMQQYLPEALRYEYQPDPGSLVYQSLFQRKPWYSLYGHDLFDTLVFHNDLRIATMGTGGMGIQSHMLGKRHYELSNHLGNVQATVLDRTTPVIADPDGGQVRGYHADMATAVDYYPFGMPMPGRYVSDTARHCITVNQTVLVPRPVTVSVAANPAVAYRYGGDPVPSVGTLPPAAGFGAEKLYVYHYSSLDEHPEGWVVQTSAMEGGKAAYQVDLSGEPSGISAYLLLHMDTSQSEQVFGFSMELPDEGSCQVSMRVRQYSDPGGTEYYGLTDWMEVHSSGYRDLVVAVDKQSVKAGGLTVLEWQFSSYGGLSFAHGVQVGILGPETIATVPVAENRVVTICDEKDNYRFGFNNMEKDNELKGMGNSLDFGARMHDPRTGRLGLSLDPLFRKFPNQSPYIFAGNNPIWNVDEKGEKKTTYNVLIDERAGGVAVVHTTTSTGLMAIRRTDMHDNRSYDWYDYSEINVTSISSDGKVSNSSSIERGALRTNTLFKLEKYASLKVNDYSIKEKGTGHGWTLTTKSKLFPGNTNQLNPDGRGRHINVDDVSAAFGMASAANGADIPKGIGGAFEYLKNAVEAADGVQQNEATSINLGSKPSGTATCPSCKQQKDSAHIDNVNGVGAYQKETTK